MDYFPDNTDSSADEDPVQSNKPSFSQVPKKRKYEPENSNGSPKKANTSNSITPDKRKSEKSNENPKKRKKEVNISPSSDEDQKPSFPSHPKKKKYEPSPSSTSSLSDDKSDCSAFSPPSNTMLPLANTASVIKSTSSAVPVYSSTAAKMMAKMGYTTGKGLGSKEHGRVEPVAISSQRGRRGLGLHLKGLETSYEIEWDPSKDSASVNGKIDWMPNCEKKPPVITELRKWVKEGRKKLTIDDEFDFCSPQILKDVLGCKSIFDELEPEELRKARTRSNPFETIGKVFFQNRAALKMAEMDANFDFMFTSPKDENNLPIVKSDELLYFADICAGPGGFSEYILWRKKWHAKGFGLTLKSMNDFKLEEFYAGSPETFEPHYGVNGFQGDGDIYKSDNLREFRRHVLDNTESNKSVKGVHFVMADGGFSVEGQENIQEILSKQLYLCQFLCALSILRTDGHFVCKLFDIFTTFSVGLVYLLYRSFKKVCIFKPNTSRPANSERYVVCKWKRDDAKDIHDYMYEVNCQLSSLNKDQDLVEIVPMEILQQDTAFYQYIVDSNNEIGQRQVISLDKIRKFTQNTALHEIRQSDLRSKCLEFWNIPDKMRSAPGRVDAAAKLSEILPGESTNFLNITPEELTCQNLKKVESIYDYRCAVSGVEKNRCTQSFILSLGRQQIFKWDGRSWIKSELMLELPAGTLLFAEIVPELRGEGRAQKKIFVVHIVDVLLIGGENKCDLHFTERLKQAVKLVRAVSKPTRTEHVPIKVKECFKLEDVDKVFERLEMKSIKGSQNNLRLCYKMDDGRHFLPTGLYILKTIEEPWTLALSKSQNKKYYYNKVNKTADYSCPKGSISPFKSTLSSIIFWSWEFGVKLLDNQDAKEGRVHRHTLVNYISNKLA